MKLHRSPERLRRSKATELLQPNEVGQSCLAFDPRQELSPEEQNWIKTTAIRHLKQRRYSPFVSTTWMRWLNPDHTKWMRKYGLPGEVIPSYLRRLNSEGDFYKKEILVKLGTIVEVFLEVRQQRPEIPELFYSKRADIKLHDLFTTIALIKIWPEQREKIIEQAIGDVDSFLKDSMTHFSFLPEDLIQGGANLVLLFPETRPWVESLVLQHKDRIRRDIQEAAKNAKALTRGRNNTPFVEYQGLLRAMTILESGASYIDDKGEIQLQPRVVAISKKEQLPERPHV